MKEELMSVCSSAFLQAQFRDGWVSQRYGARNVTRRRPTLPTASNLIDITYNTCKDKFLLYFSPTKWLVSGRYFLPFLPSQWGERKTPGMSSFSFVHFRSDFVKDAAGGRRGGIFKAFFFRSLFPLALHCVLLLAEDPDKQKPFMSCLSRRERTKERKVLRDRFKGADRVKFRSDSLLDNV